MRTFVKYLIFTLALFLICGRAGAGITETTLAKFLDLSDFNEVQKGIILQEVNAHTAPWDSLAKTDVEAWKDKMEALFHRIRNGFTVYKLARDPEITRRIQAFETESGANVYLLTYVDDSFLNNIFYRLSEAFYTAIKPNSYIQFKFKFGKTPKYTEEKPSYVLKSDTILIAEAIKPKLQMYLAEASNIIHNNLHGVVSDAVDHAPMRTTLVQLMDLLEGAGLKGGDGQNQTNGLKILIAGQAYQNDPYAEVRPPYILLDIAPPYSVFDFIEKTLRHRSIIKYVPGIEQLNIPETFASYRWTTKPPKSGPLLKLVAEYQLIRSFLVTIGDVSKVNAFDEEVISSYPFYVSAFFKKQKNYASRYYEILRIAELGKLMGEEKWVQFHRGEGEIADSDEAYEERLKRLFAFYKTGVKEDLSDLIIKCTEPGNEDQGPAYGMTYLAGLLSAEQFFDLPLAHRVHMLKILVRDLGDDQEKIALNLIRTCRSKDADQFLESLKIPYSQDEKTPLIVKLDRHTQNSTIGIGGDHYSALMEEISALLRKSAGFENKVNELLSLENFEDRIINWQGDATIHLGNMNSKAGYIWVDEAEMDEETGMVTYDQRSLFKNEYYLPGCDYNKIEACTKSVFFEERTVQSVSLSPFDLVVFCNFSSVSEIDDLTGAGNGKISVMPAFFLNFAETMDEQQKIIQNGSIAIDLATLGFAPAHLLKAKSMFRASLVLFEMTSASGNVLLNTTPLQDIPELSAVVNASNMLMGAIGVTELIKGGTAAIDFPKALQVAKNLTAKTGKTIAESAEAFVKAVGDHESQMLLRLTPNNEKTVKQIVALRDELVVKAKRLWGKDWSGYRKTSILPEGLYESARKSAIARFGKDAEDLIYEKFVKEGGAAAEIINHYGQEGIKILKSVNDIQDAAKELIKNKILYRYLNEQSFNFEKIKSSGFIDPAKNEWPTYITLDRYMSGSIAKSKLQLPQEPTWIAEFEGNQIISDIRFAYAKGQLAEYIEILTHSYPNLGGGGGSQFITYSQIRVKRLINLHNGEIINF